MESTTIYKDNSACISQLKEGYKDILKVIEQNIFFQNSFSLMIFKEMVI